MCTPWAGDVQMWGRKWVIVIRAKLWASLWNVYQVIAFSEGYGDEGEIVQIWKGHISGLMGYIKILCITPGMSTLDLFYSSLTEVYYLKSPNFDGTNVEIFSEKSGGVEVQIYSQAGAATLDDATLNGSIISASVLRVMLQLGDTIITAREATLDEGVAGWTSAIAASDQFGAEQIHYEGAKSNQTKQPRLLPTTGCANTAIVKLTMATRPVNCMCMIVLDVGWLAFTGIARSVVQLGRLLGYKNVPVICVYP
ncbi:hypothetical protein C8J57DRAFT_1255760 [Mycena rebaudengoi]|nr:hypothetical protein C8J57DRAFT_1255760 [Mycena rebaudengoi]